MARVLIGRVSSDAADKTITVVIQTAKTHPLYKKQFMQSKKFLAHDEKNEAKTGDRVSIVEGRPQSARKRFVLQTVLERPLISQEAASIIEAEPVEPITTKQAKPAEKPAKDSVKTKGKAE